MSEEPIATYVEKNLERTGTYRLYVDRLEFSVRSFMRRKTETSLPLSSFANSSIVVRVHCSLFNLSLWVLFVALVLLVGTSFVPTVIESPAIRVPIDSLFVLGLSVAVLTARRLTFITIRGGASISIGIGPAGLSGLQAFIAQVLAARRADQVSIA